MKLRFACLVLAPVFAQQTFPQPEPAKEVTVAAIPGVIAAGTKWALAWQGTDNADGIAGTADGGLLFAQEQPNRIRKLDKNDKVSVFLEDTHGTGAVAIDSKGRILVVERTCTDPGGKPAQCKEATAVAARGGNRPSSVIGGALNRRPRRPPRWPSCSPRTFPSVPATFPSFDQLPATGTCRGCSRLRATWTCGCLRTYLRRGARLTTRRDACVVRSVSAD